MLKATMVWTLDAAISIWGTGGRPFLSQAEIDSSCRYLKGHLLAYQALAGAALALNIFEYKLRPKYHYLCHLLEETLRIGGNPIHLANFMDEDMMKQMRSCVHSCHPASMLRTWSRRYILKRVLVWDRLSKPKDGVRTELGGWVVLQRLKFRACDFQCRVEEHKLHKMSVAETWAHLGVVFKSMDPL